ncbi:OprD family porin, partial [Pseudomonas aeruginosa]|uniref:OprD family porin n=1 Tax=Pseudomonas aeruginosa TaxID=287 RepID=UPI0021556529
MLLAPRCLQWRQSPASDVDKRQIYIVVITVVRVVQSLSLSLQQVDGDTPFDFIAQNDRTFLYESNAMQYVYFHGTVERSWKTQYQARLAFIAAQDGPFGAVYGRGQADLTRVDPD